MYNKEKKLYSSYESDGETKIWFNHYRGYIIKNWVDPKTNLIMQERLPYNQPNHYLKFLDNYFLYNLK